MRKIIASILTVLIFLTSVSLVGCSDFGNGNGQSDENKRLLDSYNRKSSMIYDDSGKVKGEIVLRLAGEDTDDGEYETSYRVQPLIVYSGLDGNDPMYRDRVYYENSRYPFDKAESYYVESEEFYNGRAFYTYLSEDYEKKYYSECDAESYLRYKLNAAYNLSDLSIDGLTDGWQVFGKDGKNDITFKYTKIDSSSLLWIADYLTYTVGFDCGYIEASEFEYSLTYDEQSCAEKSERIYVKGVGNCGGTFYKFEYEADLLCSMPEENDKISDEYFEGFNQFDDITYMSVGYNELRSILYPSRSSGAGISFDIEQTRNQNVLSSIGTVTQYHAFAKMSMISGYSGGSEASYYFEQDMTEIEEYHKQMSTSFKHDTSEEQDLKYEYPYLITHKDGEISGVTVAMPENIKANLRNIMLGFVYERQYLTDVQVVKNSDGTKTVTYRFEKATAYLSTVNLRSPQIKEYYVKYEVDHQGNIISMGYYIYIDGPNYTKVVDDLIITNVRKVDKKEQ